MGDDVYEGVVADGRDFGATRDRVGEEKALEGLGVAEGYAIDGEDQVTRAEAGLGGGAPGDDLDDPEGGALVEAFGQGGTQRCRGGDETEVRAADPAVMQE